MAVPMATIFLAQNICLQWLGCSLFSVYLSLVVKETMLKLMERASLYFLRQLSVQYSLCVI